MAILTLVEPEHWRDDDDDCDCDACGDFWIYLRDQHAPARGRCRSSVEQLGRGRRGARKHRRGEKRFTVRLMRRIGKLFLDDSPRRIPFRGWND